MDALFEGILYKRNSKRFEQIKAVAAGFSELYIGSNIIQDDIFTAIENYAKTREIPLEWLRFPIVFTLGVLAITALYRVCLSKRGLPGSTAWPGAVFASVGLVAGTGVFSMFISLSSRYSLVYGSLANIMLLMLYLFVCSNILVTGSLINCLRAKGF